MAALRFYSSLAGWVRVWLWCICIGLALALIGLHPSLIGLAALLGPVWVGIGALALWGRWLDETMHLRSDLEDGPR